jgi:hypothetical protein
MTGTNCDLFTHNQSRSYLNHLVKQVLKQVLKITTFQALDLSPSSGERGERKHILWGPLNQANPNQHILWGPLDQDNPNQPILWGPLDQANPKCIPLTQPVIRHMVADSNTVIIVRWLGLA